MFQYIVAAILIVLAGVFAILQRVWTGFAYFMLALLVLLSLFWAIWLIYDYFHGFRNEQEERFKFYEIEMANQKGVDLQTIKQNEIAWRKAFSKKMLKEKIVKWFVIAFCFACVATFITAIVLYKS